jgi:hypothetical protein
VRCEFLVVVDYRSVLTVVFSGFLHSDPTNPYENDDAGIRWFPVDLYTRLSAMELRV